MKVNVTENVKHKCYIKTTNVNVQKLISLNLVLRTTIMTPVKPQISKLRPRDLAKWALTCYGGSTHECLLSESCRSYKLTCRMHVIACRPITVANEMF